MSVQTSRVIETEAYVYKRNADGSKSLVEVLPVKWTEKK